MSIGFLNIISINRNLLSAVNIKHTFTFNADGYASLNPVATGKRMVSGSFIYTYDWHLYKTTLLINHDAIGARVYCQALANKSAEFEFMAIVAPIN